MLSDGDISAGVDSRYALAEVLERAADRGLARVDALATIGRDVDRFIGFELGSMFVPYGRIPGLAAYEGDPRHRALVGRMRELCDRVAIVDHGKLLDIGTTQELLNRHGGDSHVKAELKHVPDGIQVPGKLDGLTLDFDSETPIEEISKLTQQGVEFQNLQISQPDLENVFLKLTGRRLRD